MSYLGTKLNSESQYGSGLENPAVQSPECLSNLSTSPYFFQQFKQMQNSFNPALLSETRKLILESFVTNSI